MAMLRSYTLLIQVYLMDTRTPHPSWGRLGFKMRIRRPYPLRVVKGD